jgi:hypothetical protein
MRAIAAVAVAAALAVAACYAPDLPPCTVTCVPGGVACPAEFTCAADGYCHDIGDTASCTMSTTLSVTISGAGSGRVVSAPAGIDCAGSAGPSCDAIVFPVGEMIELTATPNGTDTFAGWSGDACAGTIEPTCAFTLASAFVIDAELE